MTRRLAVAALAAMLTACTGPRPEVVGQTLNPPRSAGDPWIAMVRIRNAGRGEGKIEAVARLHAVSPRETVAQASQEIQLSPFETVDVQFELKAPPGRYELGVSVNYPP